MDNQGADDSGFISLMTIFSLTMSAFSLLACLSVIILYIAFKSINCNIFSLVFFLSFALLASNIGHLVVIIDKDKNIDQNYCNLQGLLITFGNLSMVFWIFIMTYYVYRSLKGRPMNFDGNRQRKWLIFGYFIPFFMSLIPLMSSDYGISKYQCLIKEGNLNNEILYGLFEFYLPLWFLFLYIFYVSFIYYFQNKSSFSNNKNLKEINKIKWYIWMIFLCWICSSINKICVWNEFVNTTLFLFDIILSRIQGVLVFVLFIFNEDVKEIITKQLCGMMPCFYSKKKKYRENLKDKFNSINQENKKIENI